jgi:tRNA A58 N-methylase Trm61
MASTSGNAGYVLGNSDAEHERLIRQAKRLAPVTERFLCEAGIGPGQRVLDVGAGDGDVTILLSHLVGPAGEVVSVERDARSIDRARARVIEAGLQNVTFAHTDVAQFCGNYSKYF